MDRLEILFGNVIESQADAVIDLANTILLGGQDFDSVLRNAAGLATVSCPNGECIIFPTDQIFARYNFWFASDKSTRMLSENWN